MLKGSSVDANLLINSKIYRKLLKRNFNCLYVKSGFKARSSVLKKAKIVSEFALENNLALRGNHLFNSICSEEKFKDIEKVLAFFPEIPYWECCHELIADDGNFRKGIKLEQIKEAFLRAKNHSPNKKFFYCDYGRSEIKWHAIYRLIEVLKASDIPIDGFSVQIYSNLRPVIGKTSCLTLNWELNKFWIQKIKNDFDLIIHAPEVTVWQPQKHLSKHELTKLSEKSKLRKEIVRAVAGLFVFNVAEVQRYAYQLIVNDLLAIGVELIGFWSAFDASPWNWHGNRCRAGFWDEEYKEKPCKSILNNY